MNMKFLVDTLSMARALEVNGKHSLAFLSEKYGLGKKGTEVIQALGKHRADFSSEDIWNLGGSKDSDKSDDTIRFAEDIESLNSFKSDDKNAKKSNRKRKNKR